METQLVCRSIDCACAGFSTEECACIPDGDHARARCTECSARMVLIDINTGLPVDRGSSVSESEE